MKRNWDTIREILAILERFNNPSEILRLASFPPERKEEILYHIQLLLEAGLVHGEISHTLGSRPIDFSVNRLTWYGHEFLEAIDNEAIWNKTKSYFFTQGLSMTFDLIKSVASDVAGAMIKSAIRL
jgi:hypothetical protein